MEYEISLSYCDGFGVPYATTYQNTRYIRCDRCYSTATQQLRIPKQPNCWKTGAMGNAIVRECVFYSRRTHCIWRAGDKTQRQTRVEAGSNTSTVTLRVVRGDELGSLKSETVKYGREYQGTRSRERLRWEDPAAYTKDRPVLSSERAPHKNKIVTVKW
jgi:hypothetical protein